MNHLATLQADFQAYLMDDARKTAFKAIVDDRKVGATKRLKIYHDAYRLRIIEALGTAYPMLKAYLGDDLFESTIRSYLTKTPSIYPNLRWYGAELADHLKQTLPKHPTAAELAQFEWALGLAFDAEDGSTISLPDLAQIPPESWGNLRFKFDKSMQILSFNSNAAAIWQALNAEKTPPKGEKNATETHYLIWRQALTSKFRSLELSELQALQMGLAGSSFGEICETLFASFGDAAISQAAQYLAGWLEADLIAEL